MEYNKISSLFAALFYTGTVSTITLAAKRGRASAPALSTPKVWARSYRVSSLPYLEPFKRLDKGPNASVSFLASVAFCITTQGTALLRYMPTQLKAAGLPRKQVFLPDNDSNTEPCTCTCLMLCIPPHPGRRHQSVRSVPRSPAGKVSRSTCMLRAGFLNSASVIPEPNVKKFQTAHILPISRVARIHPRLRPCCNPSVSSPLPGCSI